MNKMMAQRIGSEVSAALKAIAAKHNLTVEVNGGRFSSTSYTPRVVFKTVGADKAEFESRAWGAGLAITDLGRGFIYQGQLFTVTGIRKNAPRRPVTAERQVDGKTFCFTVDAVKKALAVIDQNTKPLPTRSVDETPGPANA
jgi:hypothetical protein